MFLLFVEFSLVTFHFSKNAPASLGLSQEKPSFALPGVDIM
jgi:hypothetical protein